MTEKIYRAALVIIGNEVLSGRTQDANIAHIAVNLNEYGIRLMEVRVVPDIEKDIIKAVNELRAENDYVFTTGGIGPTHDDITAASIAKAFGVTLERSEQTRQMLLDYYGDEAALTPARLKMADIPAGAKLVPNPVSGAPGIHIGNVYVMAGVPRIMQAMLDNILPTLKGGAPVLSRTVTCGMPESQIADELSKLQDQYPHIDIGSYPSYREGKHSTALVLRGTDPREIDKAAGELEEIIRELGGEPVSSKC